MCGALTLYLYNVHVGLNFCENNSTDFDVMQYDYWTTKLKIFKRVFLSLMFASFEVLYPPVLIKIRFSNIFSAVSNKA
jgi:hypothetical protein